MSFIDGKKLSEHLDNFKLEEQKEICREIGESVAKLHKNDIIHGDLTTSNMILQKEKIYFIDFGLGYISRKTEDKAVDLYLLKQALEAKHFTHWKILFEEISKSYEKISGKTESKKYLKESSLLKKEEDIDINYFKNEELFLYLKLSVYFFLRISLFQISFFS